MNDWLVYLLKVNGALAVFYLFYRVLLAKDTFFRLRRVTLLAAYIVAFVGPLLPVAWVQFSGSLARHVDNFYQVIMPEMVVGTSSPRWDAGVLFSRGNVLAGLYVIGALVLGLRLIQQLGGMLHLLSRSRSALVGGLRVRRLEKAGAPFSFFGWIFLLPEAHSPDELREILVHESVHVRQGHSFDVLLSEAVCILCWFNPFAWLLKREVRHNLEYLADSGVLRSGFDSKSYQYHLLGLALPSYPAAANLYNHFNLQHLKDRIRMMNKRPSLRIGRAKYLLLLPLTAAILAFGNTAIVGAAPTVKPSPKTTASPALALAGQDTSENGVVTYMPKFPGGDAALLKFIHDNLKYPAEAVKQKIQGRVTVQFTVAKDGSVCDAHILRSLSPILDAEALRVVNMMPAFQPGRLKNGEAAQVKYCVPVTFSLMAGKKVFR